MITIDTAKMRLALTAKCVDVRQNHLETEVTVHWHDDFHYSVVIYVDEEQKFTTDSQTDLTALFLFKRQQSRRRPCPRRNTSTAKPTA